MNKKEETKRNKVSLIKRLTKTKSQSKVDSA